MIYERFISMMDHDNRKHDGKEAQAMTPEEIRKEKGRINLRLYARYLRYSPRLFILCMTDKEALVASQDATMREVTEPGDKLRSFVERDDSPRLLALYETVRQEADAREAREIAEYEAQKRLKPGKWTRITEELFRRFEIAWRALAYGDYEGSGCYDYGRRGGRMNCPYCGRDITAHFPMREVTT